MKKFNRKGFTMVELLIVLAIIAILAAVAIPVYSSQLESARKKTDEANVRAAAGLAAQDYLARYAGQATGDIMGNNPNNGNGQNYNVYALVDPSNPNIINMAVYPAVGWIDRATGTWYPPNAQPSNNPIKILDAESFVNNIQDDGNPQILGKDAYFYPVQQNNGKGRIIIEIASGGVVRRAMVQTSYRNRDYTPVEIGKK